MPKPRNQSRPPKPARTVPPNTMRITKLEQQVRQLLQAQKLDGRKLGRLDKRVGAVERARDDATVEQALALGRLEIAEIHYGLDLATQPDETVIAVVDDGRVVDVESVSRSQGHGFLRALQALHSRLARAGFKPLKFT